MGFWKVVLWDYANVAYALFPLAVALVYSRISSCRLLTTYAFSLIGLGGGLSYLGVSSTDSIGFIRFFICPRPASSEYIYSSSSLPSRN